MARRVSWLSLLLLLPWPVSAAPPRGGAEFRVNTYTTGQQMATAVASHSAGRFVVLWESTGQDGDNDGIFGQRFEAAGTPLGPEFQVSVHTTNAQSNPAVAMGPTGSFVVVWASFGGQDGDSGGIFARRFDASGSPVGGEFQVNQYTTGNQFGPTIATDAAGNFVVAWTSTAHALEIRARRFDPSLVAGNETALNSSVGVKNAPALAMNPDGTFVAAWNSFGQDGSSWGAFARQFDPDLTPLGGEIAVNTYTSQAQDRVAVAVTGGGAFTVVWQSAAQDGAGFGVFARRFNAAGSPLGGEIPVNVYTTDDQQVPKVAADGSGGFLVVWESWTQDDGTFAGVQGRSFDAAGLALDPVDFLVNTNTPLNQRSPAISADADGRFVVAWDGDPTDNGSSYAIHAQRFGDLIFKDGVESGNFSAWSSTNGGADLGVSGAAAMGGTSVGLQAVVNDTAGLYVQDDSPADEGRYRARFYLDPNGFDPGEAQVHFRTRTLIAFTEAPTRRVAAVVLRRIGGNYAVMARARRDDDTQANTGFFPISDAPHAVEIELVRASDPDANDGALELWIDGVSMIRLGGLDNSRAEVDFARMGALSVKTGAAGTLYFDEFESRRASFVGVLP
jgi:hypothetical protein